MHDRGKNRRNMNLTSSKMRMWECPLKAPSNTATNGQVRLMARAAKGA